MKTFTKKALCCSFILACGALLFAGGKSDSGTGKVKIGAASLDFSNANQSYLSAGYRYWSSQYPDVTLVDIIDGKNDQTYQNDQIDILINKGINVLICNLVNSETAPTVIEKCKKANIPVIFINKNPPDADLQSYDRCLYVGVDAKNQGRLQGTFMEDAIKSGRWDKNGDGKIQYVLLLGQPGHTDTTDRADSFIKYCKDHNLPVDELARQNANWSTTDAKNTLEAWIGRFGERIEFVVSGNDAMALGAVEALRAAGMITDSKITPVIGVNALPEVSALIQSSVMLASILTNPSEQAHAAVEMARAAVLKGGAYDTWVQGTNWTILDSKDIRVPDTVITRDNVQVALDAYKK
jgi:methyl-galactoside transport system substrate-binding protein